MSIKIEHRNLEIWKTRNDFFVQVRNFLLPLSLKVLRHKERSTIFLNWLFHLPSPTNMCRTRYKCLREQAKTDRLPRGRSHLNSTNWLFQNLPKSSARFRCVTSFALVSLRFPSRAIETSLSDTSAPRARGWTTVLMLHLTNPCAEPKGSLPN